MKTFRKLKLTKKSTVLLEILWHYIGMDNKLVSVLVCTRRNRFLLRKKGVFIVYGVEVIPIFLNTLFYLLLPTFCFNFCEISEDLRGIR